MQLVARKKPAAAAVKKEQAPNHRCRSPPLLSCDTLCKHSVLVSPACSSPSTHAIQEQAWLVVPPRAGRKKTTEQARPYAASVTFFRPFSSPVHPAWLPVGPHLENTDIICISGSRPRLYTLTTVLTYNRYIGHISLSVSHASLLSQDHKVFARHDKLGMFEVPKEFLNTNKQAPAAVKKVVRQACRAYITKNREDSCAINYMSMVTR